MRASVRVELLGKLVILREDLTEAIPPRGKSATLLAKLAYEVGQEHPREVLIELLWPESDLDSSRVRLRTVLSDLRALLEPEAASRGTVISSTRHGVALRAGSVSTDVSEFLELVARANSAPDKMVRAELLAEAAKRYTGELLPGHYEDWVITARDYLARRHVETLRELAACREQLGDLAGAVEAAHAAVHADRLSEETHCLLMRLHLAAGRPAEVLRQYAVLERTLLDELELQPSETARRVAEAARRSEVPGRRNGNGTTPIDTDSGAAWHAEADTDLPTAPPCPGVPPPACEALAAPVLEPPSQRVSRGRGRLLGAAGALILLALLGAGLIGRGRSGADAFGVSAPGSGSVQWITRYAPAADEKGSDPTSVCVDPQGNICLTGFAHTQKNDVDFLTLKYSPQGRLLWRRRYNGAGNDVDRARCIATDMAGNIYVAGDAEEGRENGTTRLSGLDVVLIKYASDGRQLWVRRWDGGENGEDRPVQFSVHPWRQEVTLLAASWRRSSRSAAQVDTVLLKYDAHGTLQWSRIYGGRGLDEEPPGSRGDAATGPALILDDDGTSYAIATAGSESPSGMEKDIVLLKHSPDGRLIWARRYGAGNHTDDIARAVCGSHLGIVVVGEGAVPPGAPDAGRVGCLTLLYSPAGEPVWSRSLAGDPEPIRRVLAAGVAPDGGLYISGLASNEDGGPQRYRTVRRLLAGSTEWAHTWGGVPEMSWPDGGAVMALDRTGGVYVAANAMDSRRMPETFQDYAVGAVTASGKQRWRQEYDANRRRDAPTAIALDRDGVIVTGQSFVNEHDGNILTIKYRR